ncbi:hypothetical protein JZ751_010912 [Albula glossodonta]|uniref:Uncharacterized protein n=1 Tax=Albula glossodonta TaxID=121402 RepID=A0A8T2NTG4_9TELE|nr:hypothetical protein JZ751_010912 [Albula glossodonta]
MAGVETQLMLSVGLIERDVNNDVLWVWCYPSVSAELRDVVLRKCCLTVDSTILHTFVFGQFSRTWYYITTVEVQEPTALKKVGVPLLGVLLKCRTKASMVPFP